MLLTSGRKRNFSEITHPGVENRRNVRTDPLFTSLYSGRRYSRFRRRSTNVYRRSNYRPRYARYGLPYTRGPAARVNVLYPEKKNVDIDLAPYPISFGNVDPNEDKAWDTTASNIFTAWDGDFSTGDLLLLNSIPAGSGQNNRVGRLVQMKSVLIQLTWRLRDIDATGAAIPMFSCAIRSMLVWDKQPNNSQPVTSDILKAVLHIGNSYSMPNSPNNLSYRDRFTTLWDCHDTLCSAGDNLRQYDKYIKLNKQSVWSTNDGGVGSITTGALWLILLSDQEDASGDVIKYRPVVKLTTRCRYTDL